MKSIKTFLKKFTALEFFVATTALLLSLVFVTIGATAQNGSHNGGTDSSGKDEFVILRKLSPDKDIYNIEGAIVNPFDASFTVYYETNHPEDYDEVIATLDNYVVPYHKLFDRHNYYYETLPENEAAPTPLEKTSLPQIRNLNYVNDHFDEDIEIAKPLYELLSFVKEKTIFSANNSDGAFNMFIGDVYDFWKPFIDLNVIDINEDPLYHAGNAAVLNEIVAAIPKTEAEINASINLWTNSDKYYVRLSKFAQTQTRNPSISLGAAGKGYMADILKEKLIEKNLIHGVINGGTSTITFLKDGSDYDAQVFVEIVDIKSRFASPAIVFERDDHYALSTSGLTEGYSFKDSEGNEVVRGHIVNPLTGYAPQNKQRLVTVLSNELSGFELDYLTTTLIVLAPQDAIAFLRMHYGDIDYSVFFAGYENGEKFLSYSDGFPGENGHIISQNSEYREIFLDLL